MPRHANLDWNLPEGKPSTTGGNTHSWESIHSALLMDIRDELQKLNRLLTCENFLRLPQTLKLIEKNTRKRKRILTKKAKGVGNGSGGSHGKRRALGMKAG